MDSFSMKIAGQEIDLDWLKVGHKKMYLLAKKLIRLADLRNTNFWWEGELRSDFLIGAELTAYFMYHAMKVYKLDEEQSHAVEDACKPIFLYTYNDRLAKLYNLTKLVQEAQK